MVLTHAKMTKLLSLAEFIFQWIGDALVCPRMTLVRKKIVASMLTWVSLLINVEFWVRWPQRLKLLKLGWICLALQQ